VKKGVKKEGRIPSVSSPPKQGLVDYYFFAAHGFLAAQGFAWAKVRPGVSKNAVAITANTKRMNLCFIESSSIAANCGFVTLKTKLGE